MLASTRAVWGREVSLRRSRTRAVVGRAPDLPLPGGPSAPEENLIPLEATPGSCEARHTI